MQHPKDKVLLTSSIGEDVDFICKVELAYNGITWKINGTLFRDIVDGHTTQTVSGDVYTDVLTLLRIRSSYNQTRIMCTGYGDEVIESNEVKLSYQGRIMYFVLFIMSLYLYINARTTC